MDLVLLGALWGASFLFLRIATPEFGPVPIIFVRVGVAAVLLGVMLAARGGLGALSAHTGALCLLGAINTAVPFTLFAFATMELSAGLASALNATVPLFSAVVAVIWIGERLGTPRLIGVLTGFAGVLVLAWPRISASHGFGALLAICPRPAGSQQLPPCVPGTEQTFTSPRLVPPTGTTQTYELPPGTAAVLIAASGGAGGGSLFGKTGSRSSRRSRRFESRKAARPMRNGGLEVNVQ
jgi:uncharacterized membrane protein